MKHSLHRNGLGELKIVDYLSLPQGFRNAESFPIRYHKVVSAGGPDHLLYPIEVKELSLEQY